MTDQISHADFPSRKLVHAFENALEQLRVENKLERRRMAKMRQHDDIDHPEYVASRVLKKAYKAITDGYGRKLIEFLNKDRTSSDQEEDLETGLLRVSHDLLYSQMSPISHTAMIRLYELADRQLTLTEGKNHTWHGLLSDLITEARFDREVFDSVSKLCIKMQMEAGRKEVFDTHL